MLNEPQKIAGLTDVAISKLKETLAEKGQGKHGRKWKKYLSWNLSVINKCS